MSTLKERLRKRGLREEIVTIEDFTFVVKELHPVRTSELIADSKDSKGREKSPNMIDGRLLSACVFDENGDPVFTDAEWNCWLTDVGGFVMRQLMNEVMRLNGLGESEVKREEKKSEPPSSSGSPTD